MPIKKLSEGGMGSVVVCQILDTGLAARVGKNVCVAKVVKPQLALNELVKAAFSQEVSIMTYLTSHRNIAKIVGFVRHPPILLMVYYPYGTLSGLIHNGITGIAYTSNTMFNLVHGIACGLMFMHQRFVAHCDVKPLNILLDVYQTHFGLMVRPKLTDFGISRVVDARALKVQAFQTANIDAASIRYASPQALLGLRQQFQLQPVHILMNDVYSVSMVMMELVNRRLPWN